ncbi:MAG: hypothetical protein RIA69_05870 [Cyclobacteriaceae bacterium]
MESFSKSEIILLKDQDFLLTKRKVSKRVKTKLRSISESIDSVFKKHKKISEAYEFDLPKISSGENYQGLPYFVLDCPRHFKQSSIFSYRTIVWWGHEISCSLIVSGDALNASKESIFNKVPGQDFYFCVNNHPWDHHFKPTNYITTTTLDSTVIKNHIERTGFVKLADKIDISEIDNISAFSTNSLARFLSCI